ncbi:monovalent cation:proton antiporter-2 (CPA2) family protein [Hellea balneolensis]|uniref:monovalent cation:proton antiporter-2 (CPA2) family protein n=1 Tax=Hellea balneolensis TaxID=287478 RepID=UPI0004076E27|nr:monovalent cation:proton antiporter-2 (CPA2) family protein [Hellea balneolensis]
MDGSLLQSVFVFLAAACLLVPISKLSGLGSVIGYLIAGVIIGPFVLGFISEPETILHFSEFGVVMMLFLIGLELQPKHLWEMRGKLLGLGGLQVGLTTVLVTFAALALGRPTGEAIVIGMALALSSTAIALQIMQDRKIMKDTVGRSGFSVLLFQDVIVIAMIAALPFLATMSGFEVVDDGHGKDHHGPQGLWLAASMFAVFAGMILAGRFVLRPLFKLIAKSQVRETFTAMALLLVIGAALLMEWLGLSAALGAFIAGVVLADSDYRHQLERDIEPFKALLLGLFFISVGMSLDFNALGQNPLGIMGLVIGLMALKFAVLFIIGTIFKLEMSGRLLFSTLLCQAGEFGFVLFSFALVQGAVRPETATVLNAVIAISMALTPLLILGYDKFVLPRFGTAKKTGETPENNHHKVLVLGFGRVGQVAARLLHTQKIETTIIDLDGEHIEFVRKFGHRVFYGDASDIDLLRKAGAHEADVIIIAIDDTEKATEAAHEIMQHFPQAKVIARARNRGHLFDLLAEEVDFAERETIRGALAMGQKALEYLDYAPEKAKRLADDFLAFDFKMAQEAFEMRGDLDALASHVQTGHQRLMDTLNADAAQYGTQDYSEEDEDDGVAAHRED